MYECDLATLRLELNVDAMRLQIMHALHERQVELQELVNSEVERTKTTLEATLREAVRKGIDQAIRKAVENEMWRVQRAIEPGIGKAIADLLTTIGAGEAT